MPDIATVNDNKNKQLIDMLRRSRLFRDYENVFTKATGLPLALRPLEYWQLEHHQKTNENPFCALLAQRSKTLAVCLQSHAEIIRHTGIKARTETCPFGLTETAVPGSTRRQNDWLSSHRTSFAPFGYSVGSKTRGGEIG